MDANKIRNSDYLDILFEGRNKAYGGYQLRKTYPKRVVRSLLVLAGVVVAVVVYGAVSAFMANASVKLAKMNKEVKLMEPPPVDPTKPPPPPPPPAPPPPVKPTVAFTPPVIKKDEEVKEDEKPPEQADLKDKAISTETKDGDPNGMEPDVVVDTKGVGDAPAAPAVYEYVSQMPEAPYNVQKYLSETITYPESARNAQVEGKVIVRFVVQADGSISDAKVVRSLNGDCDQEAIKAIKSMPKWKPGRQNGQAVPVYFTQPVTFKLE